MRIALVNPNWRFEGSIYFGCREPHLPLEYGYSRVLLEQEGHDVLIADAQLHDLDEADLTQRVAAFAPDCVVMTTAPSYLFWRCAPPELRVRQPAQRFRLHDGDPPPSAGRHLQLPAGGGRTAIPAGGPVSGLPQRGRR